MVMKGGKKRALSPAKEGEAAALEEVPLTRSVKHGLSTFPILDFSGDLRMSLPRS